MTDSVHFLQSTVPGLLDHLSEDTQAKWGIMQPQHMVEHVSVLFYFSSKDLGIGVIKPPEAIGISPDFVNNEKPMPRMIQGAGLKVGEREKLRFANLDEAKQRLLKGINGFFSYFNEHPGNTLDHPVFGPLTYDQWLNFHHKHVIHHFSQFGLIEETTS